MQTFTKGGKCHQIWSHWSQPMPYYFTQKSVLINFIALGRLKCIQFCSSEAESDEKERKSRQRNSFFSECLKKSFKNHLKDFFCSRTQFNEICRVVNDIRAGADVTNFSKKYLTPLQWNIELSFGVSSHLNIYNL